MADAGVARGPGSVSFPLAAPFAALSVFFPCLGLVVLRRGLCVLVTAELVGGR